MSIQSREQNKLFDANRVSFYTSRHNLFNTCELIAPWLLGGKKKEEKKE